MMNTAFESTDSKIVKAPSLEALLSGIELSAPHLDFYGKNIEENAKKEKVASYIRTDVLRLIRLFEESFFVKWGIGIEDYTLSNLRRKLRLESRKRKNAANSKTPIIRTFVDRLRKGISKANFTIKANPLTNEWKDSIESVETAMAWAYSSSGMRTTLIDVIHSALLNGNGYVKAKFMTPKERLNSIKNPDSKEYIKISNFYSQVERISEFDLFYDPALPLHKQRFVVYRSIKPMKSILEVIQHMDQKISPEHLNYVLKNPKPFSHKDFNQVRLIKYLGPDAARRKNNYAIDNIYNITYNNDKAEYVEIWTPDTLSICINGWIVADTENPYKDREYWHPYYSCHYAENPGVSVGEGAGIILGDIQAAYDSLFNMLLDHSAMTASPMLWVQAGKVIFNKKAVDGTLPWEAWGVLEMEDKGNMDFITPPPLDKGIVSTLQNMLETANFSISPTSYSDYNSQSRSAQDSMLRFEGLADSVSLLVDSVSLMLNRIAQNWLIDMQSKMPELFQLPVFNAKWGIENWKKIKRVDIEGKYIFEWASDSIADINQIVEKTQLRDYMDALLRIGQMPDGSSMVDVEKLLNYINDLYKGPRDIVLSKAKYYATVAKDQEEKTQIAINVQNMQAEAQAEAQEEQAAAQQWVAAINWQWPQAWGTQMSDADVEALLSQMV